MPATTTAVPSNKCILTLDNASGTPTSYASVHTKVKVKFDAESKDTYVFGDTAPINTTKKKGTEFEIEVIYSTSATELKAVVLDWWFNKFDQAKTMKLETPDSATGSDRYSGEVKLSKAPEFDLDASKAEPAMMKFTFREDAAGALAYTVI